MNDSPSTPSRHPEGHTHHNPRRHSGRLLLLAAATAVVLTGSPRRVAAGAGAASSAVTAASATRADAPGVPVAAKRGGKRADRAAWAGQYGQDVATMPVLPDVSAATTAEQAAALDLLRRTEAATAAYADPAAAQAAGYDFAGALARVERKRPRLQARLAAVAQGTTPKKRLPMMHVPNGAYANDGKVLDPSAPETLMYMAQPGGGWKLMGVMFRAGEAYPQAPPTPGGPITRWHYHVKNGQPAGLMMHLFFTPGNDLATAYSASAAGFMKPMTTPAMPPMSP